MYLLFIYFFSPPLKKTDIITSIITILASYCVDAEGIEAYTYLYIGTSQYNEVILQTGGFSTAYCVDGGEKRECCCIWLVYVL